MFSRSSSWKSRDWWKHKLFRLLNEASAKFGHLRPWFYSCSDSASMARGKLDMSLSPLSIRSEDPDNTDFVKNTD